MDASPALPAGNAPETPAEPPREPHEGLSGVWDSHALPNASEASGGADGGDGKAGERGETGTGTAGGGARPGDNRREEDRRVPPVPARVKRAPSFRERMKAREDEDRVDLETGRHRSGIGGGAGRTPPNDNEARTPNLRAEDVLRPSRPEDNRRDAGAPTNARITRDGDTPREKRPNFLDPDYKGPSKEELDRARDLKKAIRVRKAREARQRAAERRRLQRDRDRDGPER